MTDLTPHNWVKSRLGHGEWQCTYCLATNREIAVIGNPNHCPDRAKREKEPTMTDPIITPAQMREAAARECERLGAEFAAEGAPTAKKIMDFASDLIRALPVAEQQAIRDRALEDAAQCCDAEADRCDDAVKWGGQRRYIQDCKAAAYAMRDRAYAIRAMKGKPE